MDSNLLYKLKDKPPIGVSILYALQWFIFIFASTLVIPIVIGQAFGLNPSELASFIQRTFFFVGVASLLQVVLGHRYPIIEGPAGMWWGIFIILINLSSTLKKTPMEIGQSLEMGLIITGILLAILGLTGGISKIQRFFTPLITGTYMILLAVSMSSSFIKGMLGIGFHGNEIKLLPSLISVLLTSFVIFLSNLKNPIFKSFSILIGIAAGWIIYYILGLADTPIVHGKGFVELPKLFAFGPPTFDIGIIITSVITGFILLSNLITSISVMGIAANDQPTKKAYNRGGIFTGVTHILSGVGSTVGMVPLSVAAGMIEITGVAAILPFVISTVMIILIGLIPSIGMFFAALPSPVGYAVLFTTFAQLLSFGFKEYSKIEFNSRNLTVIGFSIMLGTGVMFIPEDALKTIHPLFSYLLGNGLIVGVLFSMLLEHVIYRNK